MHRPLRCSCTAATLSTYRLRCSFTAAGSSAVVMLRAPLYLYFCGLLCVLPLRAPCSFTVEQPYFLKRKNHLTVFNCGLKHCTSCNKPSPNHPAPLQLHCSDTLYVLRCKLHCCEINFVFSVKKSSYSF